MISSARVPTSDASDASASTTGRRRGVAVPVIVLLLVLTGLATAPSPAAAAPLFTVTSSPPPAAPLGLAYAHTFVGEPAGATWAVATGTLPDGLGLDPTTGELRGTPTRAGTFGPITVRATWPGTAVAIAAGDQHTCALTDTGVADCWGDDGDGRATDQPGPYTAITAGFRHSCALTPTGAADCWGFDGLGQATDQVGPYTAIAAGASHTCALTPTGAADCWGYDRDHQATDQPGPYTTITAGNAHTCALTPTGAADCWGRDDWGQAADRPGPYTAITAGASHTCALTPTGAADCWGQDDRGQAADQPGPYTAIAAGLWHTCGLTPAGAVDCWGQDDSGQATDQPGPYTTVTAGASHTCALAPTGAADCWGRDDRGQATDRSETTTADQTFTIVVEAPTIASGAPPGADWRVPYHHTFAATAAGATWDVSTGILPDGLTLDPSTGQLTGTPTQIGTFGPITVRASWPGPITDAQTFTLTVAAPRITSAAPPDTVWRAPYQHTFTATAAGATWDVTAGTLPDGLTLDPSTGQLTGAATQTGTFGPITVRASWPGPITDAQTFTITVAARPLRSISGTVTDDRTGAPVSGVTVTLMRANPAWVIVGTDVTDAEGQYSFADVADGDHQLRFFDGHRRFRRTWYASQDTYRTAGVASIVGGAPVVADQALQALPDAWITGRVLSADGAAKVGAIVLVYDETEGYYASARTGANGYYLLWGVPPGSYLVQFVDPTAPGAPRPWFDGASTAAGATPLAVGTGATFASATLDP